MDATLLRIFGTLGRPPAAGLMQSDEEKKEANPGIDKVVTSFQKSIKIIVFAEAKMPYS